MTASVFRRVLPLLLLANLGAAKAEIMPEFREPRDLRLTLMPSTGFYAPDRPRLLVLVHGLDARSDTDYGDAVSYWRKEFMAGLFGVESAGAVRCEDAKDPVRRHFFGAAGSRDLVLVTYRDSRKPLPAQAAALAAQLYEAYVARFAPADDYPQILLVGHSLGGLVARYLLSCPQLEPKELAKLGVTVAEAAVLRQRMAFLRNRTLCAITLQTPHEGTPVADRAQSLQSILGQPAMQAVLKEAAGVLKLQQVAAIKSVTAFMSDLCSAAALSDLTTGAMKRMNASDMRPDRARRDDGSLVPILVAGSSDPSSGFLSHPSRVPAALFLSAEDQQRVLQTIALDAALHKLAPTPWGVTGDAMCDRVQRSVNFWTVAKDAIQAKAPGRPELRVLLGLGERLWVPLGLRQQLALPLYLPNELQFVDREVQVSVPKSLIPRGLKIADSLKVKCPVPQLGKGPASDGQVDSDGLVSLASALGYELTGEPRSFAHNTYDLSLKSFGSWYRLTTAGSDLESLSHRPPRTAALGKWLRQSVLAENVGPYCSLKDELPVWTAPTN